MDTLGSHHWSVIDPTPGDVLDEFKVLESETGSSSHPQSGGKSTGHKKDE
ncbi:hypothetical protein [Phaeobacter sp. 22II1-1F12B]|nr:hypothetical protein [Phaeobacter sp. 22II1-1F12B]